MARRLAVVFVAAVVTIAAGERPVRAQRPQLPAFRSGVTLVPLDVRVLDSRGRPVTDLTADDFTILEDAVPQPIAHFSTHRLTPAMSVADAPPGRRETPDLEAQPSDRRIFVIVLDRGRLQGPSKGLDGMLELVRERLLPQDLVAVVAYNRATDLTTDHERVARVIERFSASHEGLDDAITRWVQTGALLAAGGDPSDELQARIDAVFNEPPRPAGSSPQRAPIRQARAAAAEAGVVSDAGRLSDVFHGRGAAPQGFPGAANLGPCIDYLRFLQGEKHVVYVTPFGDIPPVISRAVAPRATDARVTVSIVQTGGLGVGGFTRPIGPRRMVVFRGRSSYDTDRYLTSRELAKLTGGQASFYRYADEAVERLDESTRFRYLLGYDPENTTWDGGFRTIEIRVSRPGVTVQFRHGYFAHRLLVATDSPEFERSSRMLGAVEWSAIAREIHVRVKPRVVTRSKEVTTLEVEVSIDPAGVTFEEQHDQWLASLELAVVAADGNETIVGEVWEPVDLELDAEGYARLKKQNIICTVRVETAAPPRLVKAIVYHVGTDKAGSAEARIR